MDTSRRTEGLNEAKRKPVTTIATGTHSQTMIKGIDIALAITSVRAISLDSPIRLSLGDSFSGGSLMDAPHEVQNFASIEFRPLHFGHSIGEFYHDDD